MISRFYDIDRYKEKVENQNAQLNTVNLTRDLWTDQGHYKANLGTLILFEADSWFCEAHELLVIYQSGELKKEIKLIENEDYFLGEPDIELGSKLSTATGVRLQNTENVRLAKDGKLVLKAWVARQTLKAQHLNELLAVCKTLIQ